ncbi:hypothetical protein HMPREF9103_02869 [Lentilactobacillus parafarraginis F0439]|uniref:Uncharacterized protein n=1 Tax=Lentilactobacillus parafarraginis F0439 TaxID=797515 RepID=G9ZSV5_9LACO|nr:hypothetical protein HMPREF9103_02869 [Lentilactobacillus parafarraginis F0439]
MPIEILIIISTLTVTCDQVKPHSLKTRLLFGLTAFFWYNNHSYDLK